MNNIRQTVKGLDYTLISYFPIFIKGEQKLNFRVKFLSSRNEQVVSDLEYQSGDFVDEKALLDSVRFQSVVTDGDIVSMINSSADNITITADKISLNGIVHPNQTTNEESSDKETVVSVRNVITTNPNGDESIRTQEELISLARNLKLDMDAIELVLQGKRKTHKQWTFKYE